LGKIYTHTPRIVASVTFALKQSEKIQNHFSMYFTLICSTDQLPIINRTHDHVILISACIPNINSMTDMMTFEVYLLLSIHCFMIEPI